MSKSLIGRFEHLPNRPRSDEARPLLEKIASQVKPIMSKRSWKVGTLAEFLPSNPSLLGNNMNAGQRINLRLRPPGDTSTFYEYDQLVLVMLHELTHIEHGPHDAKFYKLLAELEEEFYDLKRKGYSGEGFHGAGNHLSGFKVPEHVGKAKGLQAAQKRLDTQRKIGKGGVLGGGAITAGKSMKEILAEAAERRIRDDKACHPQDAGHAREVEEEVRKAQEESVGIDAIDLTGDDSDGSSHSDDPIPVTPPKATSNGDSKPLVVPLLSKATSTSVKGSATGSTSRTPANSADSAGRRSKPATRAQVEQPVVTPNQWSCPTCTLINPISTLTCDACATPRPTRKDDTESWYCEFCGAGPRGMGYWSCAECGWVRKWG